MSLKNKWSSLLQPNITELLGAEWQQATSRLGEGCSGQVLQSDFFHHKVSPLGCDSDQRSSATCSVPADATGVVDSLSGSPPPNYKSFDVGAALGLHHSKNCAAPSCCAQETDDCGDEVGSVGPPTLNQAVVQPSNAVLHSTPPERKFICLVNSFRSAISGSALSSSSGVDAIKLLQLLPPVSEQHSVEVFKEPEDGPGAGTRVCEYVDSNRQEQCFEPEKQNPGQDTLGCSNKFHWGHYVAASAGT
jgi:hypothetical protein